MAEQLEVYPIQFGRGLNLAAAPLLMSDGQCRVLENWRTLGTGRISTRKAPLRFANLSGEQIKAGAPYTGIPNVAGIALTFEAAEDESAIGGSVNIWTLDGYGGNTKVGVLAGYDGIVYDTVRMHVAVVNSIVFMCDEDQEFGLTIWDPNGFLGSPTDLFQPTFIFPGGESGESVGESGAAMPARPNLVLEHLNHLWMFGYGDSVEPIRPEYARFSYLGLVADQHSAPTGGDAGAFGVAGSQNLFDTEDVLPILNRGQRVVGASSGPGRLIYGSDNDAHAIFGTDYETWRRERIDANRGWVNSYAGGEGDGATWWLSPQGICRYRGGSVVDDMTEQGDGGSIRPLLSEIDLDSVMFGHAFDEQQVRFHYRRKDDTLPGADRWVGYDYRAGTLLGDRYRFAGGERITCIFLLRPSGLDKPAAQPFDLQHERISAHSSTAVWKPGDPMPGVRTSVRLVGPDGTREVGQLEGGASRFVHTGLKASTNYATEIVEVRNGNSIGTLRGDFTTLANDAVLTPEGFRARAAAYLLYDSKLSYQQAPMIDLTWKLPQRGVSTQIERSVLADSGFQSIAEVSGSIFHDKTVVGGITYYYRAKSLDTDENASSYTDVVSATAGLTAPPTGVGSGLPGEGASQGIDEAGSTNE